MLTNNGWTRSGWGLVMGGVLLALISACSLFNRQPVAVIAVSPDAGYAPLSVSLDGRGSYDRDGSIVRHEWTLGDGEIASDSHLTHVYTAQANYRVILCVTDDHGATASDEVSVSVSRFDATGAWTGVIRNDVDVPMRGPYALDLMLWQQVSDNSLSGTVKWASVLGFDVYLPIVTGQAVGPRLDITARGWLLSGPGTVIPLTWYSVCLTGRFENGSLQGTGSWNDGTAFHWTAWK
jgi:hypothetical protein